MTAMNSSVIIGVSLKMYFDPEQTIEWCNAVASIAARHEAITTGRVSLFVLPAFTSLPAAVAAFADTAVTVGAQDLFWQDRGAFTGEVSGVDLQMLGCSHVEVGHVERRTLLGEDDRMVGRKLKAALRNGLCPVICVGEHEVGSPEDAAASCIRQLVASLDGVDTARGASPLIVAYEPEWAIGVEHSASPNHVTAVAGYLRVWLHDRPGLEGSRVIYGGSAGPGLLSVLDGSVDGLFLGRFAHDPFSLERVLDEALAIR